MMKEGVKFIGHPKGWTMGELESLEAEEAWDIGFVETAEFELG